MALTDYIQRTRSILTGYGLGEKPVLLQVAADAVNTVSGSTVAITMTDATTAAFVRAGDVLSTYAPTTEALSWVGYCLSVSGAVITCVNGYAGSTPIVNIADTHDGGILQLHGEGAVTDHEIANAIQVIEKTMLWPHIFKLEFDTETANLVHGRVDLDAEVMRIEAAWQIVGVERIAVSYGLEHQSPSVAAAGTAAVVGTFDAVTAGTLYLSTIRRMVVGTDEATYPQLVEVVSLGAADIA